MGTRLLSLFAAMLLVAACATNDPTIDGTGTGDGDSNTATDTRPRGPGPVAGSEEQFVVTVGDRVFFDTDQSSLSAEARNSLDNQAAWLNQYTTYSVVVEGHADERGSDEYNMALGHRRANVIANAIMAYFPDSKLARIFSYGEEFPLDRQSSSSAWAKNRRVEFTLLLKP